MSYRRTDAVGGGGASITFAPWEHPLVWEFVGKGRYLQAAFCRSAAQLYSAKFGSITLNSLSNVAAEGALLQLLAWSKDIGCCWDESVFESGAKGGSVDVLEFLKNNDCPIQRDAQLCRIAGVGGHLEALEFLRQSCACVWDESFCEAVANEGRLEILKYSHTQHFECSDRDSPGWDSYKVCILAVRGGHIHVLEWAHMTLHEDILLDSSMCKVCAITGRLDVLQYLRGIGCEWDAGMCPTAIRNNHVNVLKWALDNGCPWAVNDRGSGGATGLHYAKNVEVIEFLINRGANINAVDNTGQTPLHWAIRGRILDAVLTFVRLGADVNIAARQRTPLHVAIMLERHEIVEVLRAAGAREST